MADKKRFKRHKSCRDCFDKAKSINALALKKFGHQRVPRRSEHAFKVRYANYCSELWRRYLMYLRVGRTSMKELLRDLQCTDGRDLKPGWVKVIRNGRTEWDYYEDTDGNPLKKGDLPPNAEPATTSTVRPSAGHITKHDLHWVAAAWGQIASVYKPPKANDVDRFVFSTDTFVKCKGPVLESGARTEAMCKYNGLGYPPCLKTGRFPCTLFQEADKFKRPCPICGGSRKIEVYETNDPIMNDIWNLLNPDERYDTVFPPRPELAFQYDITNV